MPIKDSAINEAAVRMPVTNRCSVSLLDLMFQPSSSCLSDITRQKPQIDNIFNDHLGFSFQTVLMLNAHQHFNSYSVEKLKQADNREANMTGPKPCRTKSQAVARIADRTAKNFRGHLT